MNDLGRILVVAGVLVAIVGLLLMSGFGKSWLGRLPEDIHVTRENFSLHFPIVTCLIVSVVISLILKLFRK